MSFEQADLRSIFLTNIIREEWNLHFVKPDLINVVRKIYIKLKKEDLINIMDEFDCIYLYSTNKYYSNLNATINGKVSTFVPQKNIFGEESNKDNQRKIEETKVQIKTKISPNFFNYHEKTKFHPLFLIIEKKIQDDDILIIELSYYISNYDSSYLPIFSYKKEVKFKKKIHSYINFININYLFIEPIFTVDINILSYKVSIYIFIQAPENYELKSNIKQVLYENEKYEIEKEVTKKQVQKNNSEIYRLSHDGGLYEHTTIPTVKRTKLLGFKKKKQGNE